MHNASENYSRPNQKKKAVAVKRMTATRPG